MPTKYEFEQIIIKLEEAINFFKNSPYRFNEYKLYLSNNKTIEFTFKPQNIPHLLGINIGNLKTSKILSADKPFEMLEELITRSHAIYQKMTRGEINYSDIFSLFINEKLSFFKTVLKFNSFNILGVCHYVPARSYINGDPNNYGCEYYIIFDDGENYPCFLGLKKVQNSSYYAPSSIIANFDESFSYDVFKGIVSNQEVMLVNNIWRINTDEKFYTTNTEKLSKVQKLNSLAQEYDFHLIVTRDYIYNLKRLIANFENQMQISQFLSELISAIIQKRNVRIDTTLDESCQELAKVYNLQVSTNSGALSPILLELKNLKEQLMQAKETIADYERTITSQQSIIEQQAETIKLQQSSLATKEAEIKSLGQFKEEAFQLFKKYSN